MTASTQTPQTPNATARPSGAPDGAREEMPAGFVWGASTSAFQIEGATGADGRGPSIWDDFCARPGAVLGGDTGEPGADHYRRMDEDIALMRELGLGAYRFSVSWPRVRPGGSGAPNRAGIDFYDRLTDALLEAGITPWPTLYHWDLPSELEEAGGWPVRDTALRFAEYAALMGEALGDRIGHWTTLNEPWCSAFLGYAAGIHAPGRTEPAASLAAAHHLMLGHGLAARELRRVCGAQVGIVLNPAELVPHRPVAEDVDAVRRADGVRNRLFTGPLLRGAYPDDVLEDLAPVSDFSFVADGDLETIAQPLDFIGVNYYFAERVAADREAAGDAAAEAGPAPALVGTEPAVLLPHGEERTGMDWGVDPRGMYGVLTRMAAEAPGTDLYVTENGAAYPDEVGPDGRVRDSERVSYLRDHLLAVRAAARGGAPVRGYFAWSLLDNFEWAWGYSQRFGLVHVDFATQHRTVKDSGRWYAAAAAAGAVPGAGAAEG